MFELIKNYVDDHYKYFGAYPMDVVLTNGTTDEQTDTIYTWEKYWGILNAGGYNV